MARITRFIAAGIPHHITQRGNRRMPNDVHQIAVPESEDGLRRRIGEAHRRYSRLINFRKGWKGDLWQGRFASFPMDEQDLLLVKAALLLEMVGD